MSEGDLLIAAVAAIGALVAAWAAPRRPLVALGILFLLASLSRVTLDTPIGTMRLEQPAIAATALVLVARGQWRSLTHLPRWTAVAAGGLVAYLAVLAASSALVAPEPVASLRLVAWWAISILGGGVAVILALGRPSDSIPPLAIGGSITAMTGIVVAGLFYVLGPGFDVGLQETASILPRVHAFTWEANLYASFLAMCVPFGMEMARAGSRAGWALLALMLVGLPLGVTRGAYLGFAAGVGVYLAVWLWRSRRPVSVLSLGALASVTLAIGLVAAEVLLPNVLERAGSPAVAVPGPTQPSTPGATPAGATPPGATPPVSVSAPPVATPVPSLQPYPDTIAFRIARIPIALRDIPQSPVIGLGAGSFGQRHRDLSQDGAPDHIATLAVAVLYESGVLGSVALIVALGAVILALWRASAAPMLAGPAAAFLGSIAAFLVAYQATNAMHFAHNWMVIGAALALAARASKGFAEVSPELRRPEAGERPPTSTS